MPEANQRFIGLHLERHQVHGWHLGDWDRDADLRKQACDEGFINPQYLIATDGNTWFAAADFNDETREIASALREIGLIANVQGYCDWSAMPLRRLSAWSLRRGKGRLEAPDLGAAASRPTKRTPSALMLLRRARCEHPLSPTFRNEMKHLRWATWTRDARSFTGSQATKRASAWPRCARNGCSMTLCTGLSHPRGNQGKLRPMLRELVGGERVPPELVGGDDLPNSSISQSSVQRVVTEVLRQMAYGYSDQEARERLLNELDELEEHWRAEHPDEPEPGVKYIRGVVNDIRRTPSLAVKFVPGPPGSSSS